jgi:hypothetical protein
VITVQWKGLDRLMRDLQRFKRSAVPYALGDYVNSAAFKTQAEFRRRAEVGFQLRNKFTTRSIQVEKAKPRGLEIFSRVGSTAPYMLDQEQGGRVPKKAIPGPVAAGQAPGAKRTKLVRPSARLSRIQASKGRTMASRAQRNAMALRKAQASASKVAVLERPRGGLGLFRVTGRRKLQLRLLYVVGRQSVAIKPTHMLQSAVDAIVPELPKLANAALERQCKRHRILGF